MKIKGERVNIRPKKSADAKNDYRWQSDPELSALDAITPLTLSFQDYYQEYIETLKRPFPNRITFAVDTKDGRHIGNCVYYNIDKMMRETEIGIMIGERDYWSQGYGADIISTLIDYIFQRLKFQRVYLKTLETNLRAQQCFRKCGLKSYGYMERDGYKFLLMDMSRSQWQELKNNGKQG